MAGKLVEEAEALLIMSEFAKAERISKKALEELPKANTSDTDLQSRACSIHLQALFEQGRIQDGEGTLQTLFVSVLRAPFRIFSLWILLRLEAGDAEAASEQLEAYIDRTQEAEEGSDIGMSEYSAACQLLLIEIWCRDLRQPSRAAAWLEQDKHLEESARKQLRKEIEEYEADVQEQSSAGDSHRSAADQIMPSSCVKQPQQQSKPTASQSRKDDDRQLLPSSRGNEEITDGRTSSEHLKVSDKQPGRPSHWNAGTEDSLPSLMQGLGVAAAALVVTYAAYVERHALSRGTSSAIKKIKEASEKAGLMEPRI